MPATYAHNRFGDECIDALPEEYMRICRDNRDIFALGVHGPDILFYHIRHLHADDVVMAGRRMHHEPGREFFKMVSEVYGAYPEKDEMMAYVLGFLAHFVLDSYCHGYINRKVRETEYSHNLIEAQYEAYLMRLDEREPLKVDRSKVLSPSRKNAKIISRFFFLPEKKALESIRGQKLVIRLLYSRHQIRKRMVRTALSHAGSLKSAGDLFIDDEIIPGCQLINERIYELQKRALKDYPMFAEELLGFIRGENELGERFDSDFEGKKYTC